MQSRTQPRIDLKKHFNDFLASKGVHSALVKESILQKNFWRSDVVFYSREWFDKEFPKLKTQYRIDADDLIWADAFLKKLQEVVKKPNLAQNHINKQLAKFTQDYYLPDYESVSAKLPAKGHCVGHAFVHAVSYLEDHIPIPNTSAVPRGKIQKAYQSLAVEDEREIKALKKEITVTLESIYKAQHSRRELSMSQGDWSKLYNHKDRKLKTLYSLVIPFKKDLVIRVIQEIFCCDTPQINPHRIVPKFESEIIYLGFNGHATVFVKITNHNKNSFILAYFDSNNCLGWVEDLTKQDTEIIFDLLFAAHIFKEEPAQFCFQIFGLHKLYDYPAPKDFFAQFNSNFLSDGNIATLMDCSIKYNCTVSFDFWRSKGARVDYIFQENYAMLHESARFGSATLTKKLLALNAPVNIATDKSGRTPLHFAARYGFTDVMKELVEYNGIDVNLRTKDTDKKIKSATPLFTAVKYKHVECARLLLEHKANTELTATEFGQYQDPKTPLQMAVENDQVDMVKLLLEHGANLDVLYKNKDLFDLAISEKMRYFLAHEMLPLAIAADNLTQVTKMHGFIKDLNAPLPNGEKPIILAAKLGYVVLEKLINAGASIDVIDEDKNTPLYYFAKRNHLYGVKLLLQKNVNMLIPGNQDAIDATSDNEVRNLLIKEFLKQKLLRFCENEKASSDRSSFWKRKVNVPTRIRVANIMLKFIESKHSPEDHAKYNTGIKKYQDKIDKAAPLREAAQVLSHQFKLGRN